MTTLEVPVVTDDAVLDEAVANEELLADEDVQIRKLDVLSIVLAHRC